MKWLCLPTSFRFEVTFPACLPGIQTELEQQQQHTACFLSFSTLRCADCIAVISKPSRSPERRTCSASAAIFDRSPCVSSSQHGLNNSFTTGRYEICLFKQCFSFELCIAHYVPLCRSSVLIVDSSSSVLKRVMHMSYFWHCVLGVFNHMHCAWVFRNLQTGSEWIVLPFYPTHYSCWSISLSQPFLIGCARFDFLLYSRADNDWVDLRSVGWSGTNWHTASHSTALTTTNNRLAPSSTVQKADWQLDCVTPPMELALGTEW